MAPSSSPTKYERILQVDHDELAADGPEPEATARAFAGCPRASAEWPEGRAGWFSRLTFQW